MLESKPDWSFDTLVKAVGGASVFAILGKQLLRIWRPTRTEEIDQATQMIIQLRRMIARQNEDYVAMQKSHLEVIASYEARIDLLYKALNRMSEEHHIE